MEGDIKGFRKKIIVYQISIHALRVEGDTVLQVRLYSSEIFLSTPSGWRATRGFKIRQVGHDRFLSTPSEWRATSCKSFVTKWALNFYPRPPSGGRRRTCPQCQGKTEYFYPRPPSGGRLHFFELFDHFVEISIHALRVEGDSSNFSSRLVCKGFYPRPPGGGRPKI